MLENIKRSSKNLASVRGLVLCGILVGLYVVLGYFKIYITQTSRISFTFISTAAAGIILGPTPAMLVGILGDVVGYIIAPSGGAYFPGYAVTYALTGFVYGLFLYKRPFKQTILCIAISQLIISVFLNVGLNTFWSALLYKKAMYLMLGASAVKNAVTFPINAAIVYILAKLIEKTGVKKRY